MDPVIWRGTTQCIDHFEGYQLRPFKVSVPWPVAAGEIENTLKSPSLGIRIGEVLGFAKRMHFWEENWLRIYMWILPGSLACPIENGGWKATFHLKGSLFRGHVIFQGCMARHKTTWPVLTVVFPFGRMSYGISWLFRNWILRVLISLKRSLEWQSYWCP